MPKVFSDYERAHIKESMFRVGASLIRKKGIRRISVDDIVKGVNIATGSFYSFYPSKEELLWEIIKREESRIVEQFQSIMSQNFDVKTKLRKIFYDLYLQEDCIIYFLPRADIEYIIRKLPPEIVKSNLDNAHNINRSILAACHLEESQENVDILITMEQMLQLTISSDIPRSESARKKVLSILVEGLVGYFGGGGNTN